MPAAIAILPAKCLCCDAELKTPVVCDKCHTLHPASATTDHFRLLGLERRYDIDAAELDRRFLWLSREIHPDFMGAKSPEEQALAVRLSARANEAVRVLTDPVLRAEYLLEVAGGESAVADKRLPDGFLPRMMMLREEVEEALAGADADALEQHKNAVSVERSTVTERIAALARKLPNASEDEKRELRTLLNSIKYYDNVLKLLP